MILKLTELHKLSKLHLTNSITMIVLPQLKMLYNIKTQKTIQSKCHIDTIHSIFISQEAAKD